MREVTEGEKDDESIRDVIIRLTGKRKDLLEFARKWKDSGTENIEVFPFSFSSAKIAMEIESNLRKNGAEINLIDVLIASVAVEHGLKLVTRE